MKTKYYQNNSGRIVVVKGKAGQGAFLMIHDHVEF